MRPLLPALVRLLAGFAGGLSLLAPALSAAAETPPPPPAWASRFPAPQYPVPYAPAAPAEIQAVLERVHGYLEAVTPMRLVDRTTQAEVTDLGQVNLDTVLARGDFQIVSYEWGVTYSGMLAAGEATGDHRFRRYARERLDFIAAIEPAFRPLVATAATQPSPARWRVPLRSVIAPHSLDDAGAMAAAMIRAHRAGEGPELRPLIDRYLDWISRGQLRLEDGTLARHRPLANSVWLDDLTMSVPALAQMGALTGDPRYFDDAVRQVRQFAERLWVPEVGLFRHGWTGSMQTHPNFFWARANGWAVLAMVDLLEVLPEQHPGHPVVLDLLRAHLAGLSGRQGINGRWHQLLDRAETYEETSASAMFVYGLARAINRGWIDRLAYLPVASLGWNAVAAQVNERGQVEGTCIGTGMGWEPAFYAYRPVSPYAAHGYGPVLLAGAEMIRLRQGAGSQLSVHDGAVHGEPQPEGWW